MKNFKYISAFFIIIAAATICFSQTKTISFTDNSTLEVTNEQKNADKISAKAAVSVQYKDFTADLGSIGKAVPTIYQTAFKKLAKKNKSLAAEIGNIDSAYEIFQENTKYYFAALNKVNYEDFRKCSTENRCQIKGQAIIITVEDGGEKENIFIIKSMQIIKC